MKVFVFVRGVQTSFKHTVVKELMAGLNPDINTVRAIRVSIQDNLPRYWTEPDAKTLKRDKKAADKDCKNLVRKVLDGSNHQEQFIVIDNESLLPVHWQSYYTLSQAVCVEAVAVGIDVYSDENILTEGEKARNNEQKAKKDMFIASMAKYIRIEKTEDALEALTLLKTLIKE